MNGYVYILRSLKNGTYYLGSTNNLKRRLIEHLAGENKSTRNLLPLQLVFFQEYSTLKEARNIEYRLKKFKSRVIIERIIKDGLIKLDP